MSIAVDLDGTLAHYDGWKGETVIGKPVKKMLSMVLKWIDGGEDVVIFTARAGTEKGKKAIEAWLKENGLPELRVTNIKEMDMESFFDDRAVYVKRNTGEW